MAIAYVQQTVFVSPNVQFNSAQTAGNTNIIEIIVGGTTNAPIGPSGGTPGDTSNGNYTLLASYGGTTLMVWLYMFHGIAAAGAGVNQLVVNAPSGASTFQYAGDEFSGVSSTLDGSAVTGTGTFATTGSAPITTGNANDLLISLVASNAAGTPTGGSGYTTLWTYNGLAFGAQYEIVSATGTYNGNWTIPSGSVWIALQVALEATGSGTPVEPTLSGQIAVTGQTQIGQAVTQSGQILVTGTFLPTFSNILLPVNLTGNIGVTGTFLPTLQSNTLSVNLSGNIGVTGRLSLPQFNPSSGQQSAAAVLFYLFRLLN